MVAVESAAHPMTEKGKGEEPKASVEVLARNLDFFKVLHEDERNRATRLGQLATAYFGLEGLYVGAVAFRFADVAATAKTSGVPLAVFLGALIVMIVALAITARAISIRIGEGLAEPKTLAERLERDPEDEASFLLHRCVDYAVAADTNSEVNDQRANLLEIAGWCIFASIGIHGLGIAWGLGKSLCSFLGGP